MAMRKERDIIARGMEYKDAVRAYVRALEDAAYRTPPNPRISSRGLRVAA